MSAVDDLARAFCRDREHDSVTWAGAACSDCREAAEDACQKLSDGRWRIVRGDDLDPTESFADGPNIHVTDEWLPVCEHGMVAVPAGPGCLRCQQPEMSGG